MCYIYIQEKIKIDDSTLKISKALLTKGLYVLILFAVMVKHINANESLIRMNFDGLKKSTSEVKIGYKNSDNDYEKYLNFYSLGCNELIKNYGFLNSAGFNIFYQFFVPENPKAFVILIHGYLDHSGSMKNPVRKLTKEGYAVALFDLPGHGLSGGKRGDIQSFNQYVTVLKDFYKMVAEKSDKKIHLAGHSTGCSVIYDFLNREGLKKGRVEKVIFVAPLVRSYMFNLSKSGFLVTRYFKDGFKRDFTKGPSNDKEYCRFIENDDPLQLRFIPNGWLEAMFAWNDRVKGFGKLDRELLYLQGEEDRVVDYRFNMDFLGKKLNVKFKTYKTGRHHLLNESSDIKNDVLDEIVLYLEKESNNKEIL